MTFSWGRSNNMSKRTSTTRKCKNIRDRIYDRDELPAAVFMRKVLKLISPECTLLDIGCGRKASFLRSLSARVKRAWGIDLEISESLVDGNIHIMYGNAEDIPLEDDSVDLITTTNVVEHLRNPENVLLECRRILKPGGSLLILAPNKFHPPILLGRAFPHRVRQWADEVITETERIDVFPAYYKANSRRVLCRLGAATGLHVASAIYVSNHPEYFMFSTIAYRLAAVLERHLLQRTAFQYFRQSIFCHYIKPAEVN